jgi:outer membrane murein-binding lipoprotein Lpp
MMCHDAHRTHAQVKSLQTMIDQLRQEKRAADDNVAQLQQQVCCRVLPFCPPPRCVWCHDALSSQIGDISAKLKAAEDRAAVRTACVVVCVHDRDRVCMRRHCRPAMMSALRQ